MTTFVMLGANTVTQFLMKCGKYPHSLSVQHFLKKDSVNSNSQVFICLVRYLLIYPATAKPFPNYDIKLYVSRCRT